VASPIKVPYPTNSDWGNIHAKAWKDPQFRQLLETDPTQAVQVYANEVGKSFAQIVTVAPAPNPQDIPEEFWPLLHQTPPACC
jgi:hypothetical protein